MKYLYISLALFFLPFFAHAQDWCAKDFGEPNANGTYIVSGTYNGQDTYVNENGWVSFFPTNGNGWYINDVITEDYAMYYDDTIFANPWENDWVVSSGAPPAGSSLIDPCAVEPTTTPTTTVSQISYYDWLYMNSIIIFLLAIVGLRLIFFPLR